MTALLLVRLSALGDLVQVLGVAAALVRARPDWQIDLVTQPAAVPLLQGGPGFRRVVPFARRGGLGGVWRLRTALRAERYAAAVDLQGNWKSAAIARLSGAPRRLGADGPWRQEPASRWLLTERLAIPGERHPALVAWHLLRAFVPDLPFAAPRLLATAAELAAERAAVAALGIDPQRPFRVVVVTDPADPRALRPVALAAEVQAAAAPVLFVMGPAERHLPAPPGAPVLRHGPGELRRLVALGAVVAAAGGSVLGPDQGASHVLAAAGAACTVLFGPQDPRATAPPASRPLVHPAPPGCQPCRRRSCRHPDGPVCMEFAAAAGRPAATGLPPLAP